MILKKKMTTITEKTIYHRKDFKSKPVMKKEYKELVQFVEQQLLDEERKDKQIQELKRQNLKLIEAVEILNLTIKDQEENLNGECEEAYRQGGKDMLEDVISTRKGSEKVGFEYVDPYEDRSKWTKEKWIEFKNGVPEDMKEFVIIK